MDVSKLMDTIAKNNINQADVFSLIEMASNLDLKDEKNIRMLIQKGAKIAHKTISKDQEDKMVKIIISKGITPELLSFI